MRFLLRILVAAILAQSFQDASAGEAIVSSESSASFDRRQFVLHELDLDLGAPDLWLSATVSADPAASGLHAIIPLGPEQLAPLVHNGRWVFLPGGLYSAVGFLSGHQPVFTSSWFAEEPTVLVSPEIALDKQSSLPILSINRDAGPEGISMWTSDLGRPITPAPGSFSALLTLQSPKFSFENDYFVYKTQLPPQPLAIAEKELLLTAPGDMGSHFQTALRHGARVRIRHLTSPDWAGVREAIPLGMPLIWDGRAVEQEQLSVEALELWNVEAFSNPILAWFPNENRMKVIWSSSVIQSEQTVKRKTMQRHLLEQGAQYALELPSPAIPIETQGIDGEKLTRLTAFKGMRLSLSLSNAGEVNNRELNFARLPQTQAISGPIQRRAGACIDGRWGEETYPSSVWESIGSDEQNRPVTQWIEIDLQQAQIVGRIEVLHAECAGFSSEFNTSDFRVLGKAQPSEDFDRLAQIKDNRERRTMVLLEKPKALRYIRLEIIRPNDIPGNMTARIAEIEVWR